MYRNNFSNDKSRNFGGKEEVTTEVEGQAFG
jgi:hypothetical protein